MLVKLDHETPRGISFQFLGIVFQRVYTKESFKVLITTNQHEWHLLEHCDGGQFRSTLQKVVVVTILHQRIGTQKWRTDFLKTCTQKPLAKFVEKCSFSCVALSLFQGALASRLLGVYTNLLSLAATLSQ